MTKGSHLLATRCISKSQGLRVLAFLPDASDMWTGERLTLITRKENIGLDFGAHNVRRPRQSSPSANLLTKARVLTAVYSAGVARLPRLSEKALRLLHFSKQLLDLGLSCPEVLVTHAPTFCIVLSNSFSNHVIEPMTAKCGPLAALVV